MTDGNDCVYDLQVMILSGPDESARAATGWATALASATTGAPVVVFLVGAGARWALEEVSPNPCASEETTVKFRDEYLAVGGRIECCSRCRTELEAQSPNHVAILAAVETGGLAAASLRAIETSTVTF